MYEGCTKRAVRREPRRATSRAAGRRSAGIRGSRPPARRAVRHSPSWRLRDRLPTCSRRHRPAPACPSRRASGGGCLKNLLLPRGTSPSSGWPAGLALPALPTTLAPLVGLLQEGGAGRTVGTPRLPTPAIAPPVERWETVRSGARLVEPRGPPAVQLSRFGGGARIPSI